MLGYATKADFVAIYMGPGLFGYVWKGHQSRFCRYLHGSVFFLLCLDRPPKRSFESKVFHSKPSGAHLSWQFSTWNHHALFWPSFTLLWYACKLDFIAICPGGDLVAVYVGMGLLGYSCCYLHGPRAFFAMLGLTTKANLVALSVDPFFLLCLDRPPNQISSLFTWVRGFLAMLGKDTKAN